VRTWVRHHRQAFRAALVRLGRSSGALSVLVIGVALALPVGGYALLETLRGLGQRVTLDAQISVFLRAEAPREEREALRTALRRDPRVGAVRFVSREQALEELKGIEGVSELAAALGHNPLPDAYVVGARDPRALEALALELRALPAVSEVQADALWAQRLASLARIARLVLWLLAALLGFGLAAVTFNTIRLQIVTQRTEIEVSKLLGATDAFIRRPYYYFGFLQGVLGGAIALAAVAGGLELLNREVAVLASSYDSGFRLAYLSVTEGVALLASAGLLGWLGAHFSVARHLGEIEPV
jgi:cell division transport system permease protein